MLNRWILGQTSRWPVGGGYRFEPARRSSAQEANPRDPNYDGVRVPLWLNDRVIARASEDGATYCCGVTLAVWLDAWRARGGPDPVVEDVQALVVDWFCPVMGHSGVSHALASRGLGRVVSPEHAVAGDLIQYWRSVDLACPSGHSAVFLDWVVGSDGARGMRYWSSQPATDGIGIHQEWVGPEWTLHVVRAL